MDELPPVPPELLDKIDPVEVVSENYPNLASAMGMEKYKAFVFGDNLESSTKLYEELTENGFTNAKYSIGTFQDRWGEEETSLFVTQEMEGNKFVFELETDSRKTNLKNFKMYEVKHLYVIGKNGVTVDLKEDMGHLTNTYICPNKDFPMCVAVPSNRTILLPDMYKYSALSGKQIDKAPEKRKEGLGILNEEESFKGLPIILHEIGHLKDRLWKEEESEKSKLNFLTILATMGVTKKEMGEKIQSGKSFPYELLYNYIDRYGQKILQSEKRASAWAIDWFKEKEKEGAVFWHNKDQKFWHQLEVAMASYRMYLSIED